MKHEVSIDFDGKIYSLQTGKLAKFANGAVMVRCGDTMVLVTAVAANEPNTELDYMPLQVEYREKASAVGKFPGGFLKREGRPSDHEVLSSRLIDRPIRPMFPDYWNYETQILATVFSAEQDVDPDTLAAVGASAALMISDIPFNGPLSEVRVGRINGEMVVNPSFKQLKESDIDITVAGTDSSIVMVEGESKEISEEDFLNALNFAHEKIRQLNNLQNQLIALAAKPKREFIQDKAPDDMYDAIASLISKDVNDFIHKRTEKSERSKFRSEIFDKSLELVKEKYADNPEWAEKNLDKYVTEVVDSIEKKLMRDMILNDNIRLDGRGLSEIRPITCEVGILPRPHGSALFTRGETQSLTTVTLGTKRDEQMIDGLLPVYTQNFILHYNFPPYSTGEVKRLGLGRREIGHGNLADRALRNQLPSTEDFPYTVRVVSDILESNGSSSMATVCAGSLALYDAGVPMKKPVAGIAMGLIKEDEKVSVLSDILGDEDHLGDMDFKVTGTVDGITACQMDIKIDGLSIDIMKSALEQARQGRLHILGIMNEAIDTPREDLSPYAPRYTALQIATEFIGAVIGTGGETIRSICRETETDINIEDDGRILIAATSKEASDEAVRRIREITQLPEEGMIYKGKVKEIREGLGALVEFMVGRTGLVHISQLARERVENVSDVLKVGEEIEVKLLEISRDGKYRLSRKILLPRLDSEEEETEERNERRPHYGGGGRGGSRDNRGGNRDDRRPGRDRR